MKIVLKEGAKAPRKPNDGDAGHDLFSSESVLIPAFERASIPTGVSMEIPSGVVGLIWPRSGLAKLMGIDVLGGVIDSSYRGEIQVILFNSTDQDIYLDKGSKIAQIIFQEYLTYDFETVESLEETSRGESGFGSTGNG